MPEKHNTRLFRVIEAICFKSALHWQQHIILLSTTPFSGSLFFWPHYLWYTPLHLFHSEPLISAAFSISRYSASVSARTVMTFRLPLFSLLWLVRERVGLKEAEKVRNKVRCWNREPRQRRRGDRQREAQSFSQQVSR